MRKSFIDRLHCPYSGSSLDLTKVLEEDETGVKYGLVSSEVGEFPIVEGIMRLQVDEFRAPIVGMIKKGNHEDALLTAMDEVPFGGRIGSGITYVSRLAYKLGHDSLARLMSRFRRRTYQILTSKTVNFVQAAQDLGSESAANWQVQRFSTPTFLPVYPFAQLVKKGSRVLEFGCGTGQAAFLISRLNSDSDITCADYSFTSLFVGKTFFLPTAEYLCLDGDYLLPFSTSYFDYVFSSDVLHCLDSKLSLAREFQRVIENSGVIILPHLHNKLAPVQFGSSLTPKGYTNLFSEMHTRVFPEEMIVTDYVRDGAVRLDSEIDAIKVQAAVQGLTLVASNDTAFFRHYEGLWDKRVEAITNPIPNPIYDIRHDNGAWILQRRESAQRQAVPGLEKELFLPETVRICTSTLSSEELRHMKNTNWKQFTDLTQRFILIDVPERFIPKEYV
jgi:SAM-dependent methyltransferase/uncharacterized protein YbaR (Trm112 family)